MLAFILVFMHPTTIYCVLSLFGSYLGTKDIQITQTCHPTGSKLPTGWYGKHRKTQAVIVQHETGCKETRQRERTGKVLRRGDFVLGLVP